jgi:hypothetical protein
MPNIDGQFRLLDGQVGGFPGDFFDGPVHLFLTPTLQDNV